MQRTTSRTLDCADHSLANRHSYLTPAKNERIDTQNAGPIAEGMTNHTDDICLAVAWSL